MNRVLLIVEGERKERAFFEQYQKVKKMENNLDIVSFRQNINELYRICKEYIFDGIKPNNILDIIMDSNISKSDKEKLKGKFTDIYLVFDLDIQNAITEDNVQDYLENVVEIIKFFNDSTSIGQILVNYPSMESIYHIKDKGVCSYKDIKVPASIIFNRKYKDYIYNNKLTFDCNKLTQNDFNMLAAINLKKGNFIVNGVFDIVSNKQYEYELTQEAIIKKQIEFINNDNYLYVLNTALFIDVDLFGKKLYFNE